MKSGFSMAKRFNACDVAIRAKVYGAQGGVSMTATMSALPVRPQPVDATQALNLSAGGPKRAIPCPTFTPALVPSL